MVTHHLVKFNDIMSCGSRDMTYLIYHVTLQDHVIKGSSDFMEKSSSWSVTTLSGLVAIDVDVVVIVILIYLVASRDHIFKGLCNFVGGSISY